MLVIIPIVNRKEIVVSTDIDEPSHNDPVDEWAEDYFYYRGDTVRWKNEIWVCKFDNYGIDPSTQMRGFWSSQGYVNRYAFLSGKNKTFFGGAKTWSITGYVSGQSAPADCDTVGFFGLEGATLSLEWGAETRNINLRESFNTYPEGATYFRSEHHRKRSFVLMIGDAAPLELTFSITAETLLGAIGGFCAGKSVFSGLTQVGSEIRMNQAVVSKMASNGLVSIEKGRSNIKHSYIVTCASDNLDKVMDLFEGLAGVPTMYRMTSGFDYHWLYGFWTNFSFLYSNGDLSYYTVDIDTITYPGALPDGYDMREPS